MFFYHKDTSYIFCANFEITWCTSKTIYFLTRDCKGKQSSETKLRNLKGAHCANEIIAIYIYLLYLLWHEQYERLSNAKRTK